MVHAAAFRIGLGEDDPVASGSVDRANMFIVTADDLHMLADLAEQPALLLAALAPAAEVVFELRLPFGAIGVIVAVEVAEMTVAPGPVMGVFVARAIGPVAGPGAAGAAIFVARPGAIGPGVRAAVVAGQRAIVPAALAEPVMVAETVRFAVAAAPQLAPPAAVVIAFARAAAG